MPSDTREIIFNHPEMPAFLLARAGTRCLPDDTNISVVRGNTLLGGVVFTNYTGPDGSVMLHMAGERGEWLTREMVLLPFHYAFHQLRVRKVFGTVPAQNEEVLAMDLRGGYTLEARIKDMFPGANGDMLILSMYKEQCPWLKYKLRRFRSN